MKKAISVASLTRITIGDPSASNEKTKVGSRKKSDTAIPAITAHVTTLTRRRISSGSG